jgi:hypothetical protein
MPFPPAASVNVRQHSDNLTLTPPPLYATVARAFRTTVRRLQANVTSERLLAELSPQLPQIQPLIPRLSELLCVYAQVRLQWAERPEPVGTTRLL